MRLLGVILTSATLAWLLQMFLPWWSVAIAAFVASTFLARKGGHALWGSFLGGFALWVIMASIADLRNDSVLSDRVADIFFVQRPVLLILVTGIIGGLVSMLPGLCGYYMRSLLRGHRARVGSR
jgi:hypothetical protein